MRLSTSNSIGLQATKPSNAFLFTWITACETILSRSGDIVMTSTSLQARVNVTRYSEDITKGGKIERERKESARTIFEEEARETLADRKMVIGVCCTRI